MTIKASKLPLIAILAGGFLIRLILALSTDAGIALTGGGDSLYYLANGAGVFASEPMGEALGMRFAVNNLPTAPLYLVITGFFQQFLSVEASIYAIRILQSGFTVLVAYFSYGIACMLFDDERAGLVSAGALSFSLAFIVEPVSIATETVYIAFIVTGVWLYCKTIVPDITESKLSFQILVGIIFGLATLTRATGILFPVGIAGHVMLVSGLKSWKRGLQIALVILLTYGFTISTWTIYNQLRYDRFIFVSNQFFPGLWRGATDEDGSPEQNDELLGEQTARDQSIEIITSNPSAFVQRRFNELTDSYLQPHGTLSFGGESLKTLTLRWINSGFNTGELWRLLTGDGFFPKLLIYIWHYTALVAGITGIWLTRKRWQLSLVLIGFILYTTLLHFVLIALPRYIFPTYPFFWIFAGGVLVMLWDYFSGKIKGARNIPPPE